MRDAIEAPIGYLVNTGEMPVFHQSNVAGERTNFQGEREYRPMTVRNARPMAKDFSLDSEGFAFVTHNSAVQDFYDDAQLAGIYDAEAAALVCEHTGAARAHVFDHTRRSSSQTVREAQNARDPANAAHTDYTDWSARKRVEDVMGEEAEALLARRFAIVNVWRSIGGTIEEWPLAVCTWDSVDDAHLHTVERRAYNRIGQTRHASFDAGNEWFYFPRMTPDEAILIKNYDTAMDGRARYALHASFDDPTAPDDAAPRESLETRVFAFFD
ncbi:MAG: methyltransferase [Alphaproteobacteria bacterium]|nr:methyltransferase [Alphaproteobacteria bacterium]